MKKWPIIVNGDWWELLWVKAATREDALVQAATDWINEINPDLPPTKQLTLGQIKDANCPSCYIEVLEPDGRAESRYISPVDNE